MLFRSIEIDVIYGSSLRIGGWKDFPGTNKFKDNPDVQAKVAWIAQNSYPQTDLAKVTQTTGIAGLTEKEAITATQAAIWHLTNPDETPSLDLAEGDQATKDRTGKLYDYLLGEKNGGLKEPAHPTIGIKGGDLPFTLNDAKTEGKVGPIRFESNQPTAKLTSTHYATGTSPVIFGSGYTTLGEWWKAGFIMSVVNLAVFVIIGGVWWKVMNYW